MPDRVEEDLAKAFPAIDFDYQKTLSNMNKTLKEISKYKRINQIKKLRENSFDIRKFTDYTIYASESVLKDYTGDMLEPVPLLYQTGYLTIADYEKQRKRYTLCFPNEEVKYGFLESLMPSYVPKAVAGTGLDIFTLDDYIENGKVDQVRDVLSRTAK